MRSSYIASGIRSAQRADLGRVELDRADQTAAAADLSGARARLAELDSGAGERKQVLDRVGHRAEAVAQLVADRAQLSPAPGAGDRRWTSIFAGLEGDVLGRQVGIDVDVDPDPRLRRGLPLLALGGLGAVAARPQRLDRLLGPVTT